MRSDDDQWQITESVGSTALGVASARAVETSRADGLVDDPYAAAFVEAARGELDLPTELPPDDPQWETQSTYIGVRSRFFDEFFAGASEAGIRQMVLLASGLDTRPQRLHWPLGTTVYELDQQGVLDFKDRVLGDESEPDDARRVAVRVDLRHDWPSALRDAGFDAAQPTAWLAEGLLPYLPAQAEADLFSRVQELSAPGSRIAVEHFAHASDLADTSPAMARMSEHLGTSVADLLYDEPRTSPTDRLATSGWETTAHGAKTLAREYGRPDDALDDPVFESVVLLDARRV